LLDAVADGGVRGIVGYGGGMAAGELESFYEDSSRVAARMQRSFCKKGEKGEVAENVSTRRWMF